jgi:hypothetical protein
MCDTCSSDISGKVEPRRKMLCSADDRKLMGMQHEIIRYFVCFVLKVLFVNQRKWK